MNKNKNINKFFKKSKQKKRRRLSKKKNYLFTASFFITLTLNEPRTKYSKKEN